MGKYYWGYCIAVNDGNFTELDSDVEQRCNCPTKYGSYTVDNIVYEYVYTAVCQDIDWISASSYHKNWNNPNSASWVRSNTCPKGWGKYYGAGTNKPYVKNAQGYVPSGEQGDPIYGYVTRYRDAWHNFYSTRVAKS